MSEETGEAARVGFWFGSVFTALVLAASTSLAFHWVGVILVTAVFAHVIR